MKNLLILTAVLMLTGSAMGCRCCDGLWRGAMFAPCAPAVTTYSAPCPPAASPCNPCAGAPMISPGPETYAPMNATP